MKTNNRGQMRRCGACGQEFPATREYFHKGRGAALAATCKPCACTRAMRHHAQHRDEALLKMASYRETHQDYFRAYFLAYNREHAERRNAAGRRRWQEKRPTLLAQKRAYYQSHKPEHLARQQAWEAANPEKVALRIRRRNHQRRGAAPDAAAQAYMQLLVCDPCAYCGRTDVPIEIDHIVPVSKGGDGALDNLAPACRQCNNRKSSKGLLFFLNERAAA